MKTIGRFLTLCALLAASVTARAGEETIQFIVNAENPVTQLTPQEVSDYFLKKTRRWPSGDSVRFIDRQNNSPERSALLKQVLHKTSRELEIYWIGEKLYSGASAPIQVAPDAAAASLVGAFKGAIGYVSLEFKGAKGVKIVPLVTDGNE